MLLSSTIGHLKEVKVESLTVTTCLVFLKALKEALIIVQNHVFKDASLKLIKDTFF